MDVAETQRETEREVTALLRDLIRINTTNPPGNETEAAEYLADKLAEDGLECEVVESTAGRGSLVTRLKGAGGRPRLLLLSHLDVVAANPKEWSADPFGGVVKNGFVWGRGALDMKSMTAIEVMVLKLLRRRGVKLKGDVVLAATADEEKGGELGVGWLARHHPEMIRADFVLNEGGGLALPVNGKSVYTIQTAEKGVLWFRVKAKGAPAHGSKPGLGDNAIMRMNRVVQRLGDYRGEVVLVPTVKQYLTELAEHGQTSGGILKQLLQTPAAADKLLDRLAETDKVFAEDVRAMIRNTVAPTMIAGGVKENIIPSECEATFDCRVLPGQSTHQVMATLKGLLADVGLDKLEFTTIQASEPSESPVDTALYRLVTEVLGEAEPGCSVAPTMLTGGTDSRFLRSAGAVCYGFQPMKSDMPYGEILKLIHGVDERISVANLLFGTNVLYSIVERFSS